MRHAGGTDYAGQVIADSIALVAEVEQLRAAAVKTLNTAWEDGAREERQNVVASLRQEAEAQTYTVQAAEWARRIHNIADCIERGEHCEGGE